VEAEAIPVIICRRHLLDGDWRILAKWGQQRHRPLKVIVVSKAGDKTLQTAAEEGNALGYSSLPSTWTKPRVFILRAWSSSQRERAVLRVRCKLPPGIGPATEHPQAKHAS